MKLMNSHDVVAFVVEILLGYSYVKSKDERLSLEQKYLCLKFSNHDNFSPKLLRQKDTKSFQELQAN